MATKCSICYCCCRICISFWTISCVSLVAAAVMYFFWFFALAFCTVFGTTCFDSPFAGQSLWQFTAFMATFWATVLSLGGISSQLRFNRIPKLKWCIVRIFMLVPIYAIDAYLSLVYQTSKHEWPLLLTAVREIYEAVVLISFVQFVVGYLGKARNANGLAVKFAGEPCEHISGFKLMLPSMAPGADYLAQCLAGVLQYAFFMVLYVVFDAAIWFADVHGVPAPSWAESVLSTIKAISSTIAVYYLVLFYHDALHANTTKEDLDKIQPFSKFLAIKGLVMLTFYQTFAISIAGSLGWIPGCAPAECKPGEWSKEQMGQGISNFLLCIEMLAFAEWHRFAYPHDEFTDQPDAKDFFDWLGQKLLPKENAPTDMGKDILQGFTSDPDKFLKWGLLFRQIRRLWEYAKRQQEAMNGLLNPATFKMENVDAAFEALTLGGRASHVQFRQVEYFVGKYGVSSGDTRAIEVIEADKDKDGQLSRDEFADLISKWAAQHSSLRQPLL